jgi:ribonuclease T1
VRGSGERAIGAHVSTRLGCVPPPRTSFRRRPLIALIILLLLLGGGYAIRALQGPNTHTGTSRGLPVVSLASLPVQARDTVSLIQHGGPFRYPHDGIVYQNLERQLPAEPSGYYHEYTVVTPGESDRGARRIVTGRDGQFYYTADHYASFVRVQLSG